MIVEVWHWPEGPGFNPGQVTHWKFRLLLGDFEGPTFCKSSSFDKCNRCFRKKRILDVKIHAEFHGILKVKSIRSWRRQMKDDLKRKEENCEGNWLKIRAAFFQWGGCWPLSFNWRRSRLSVLKCMSALPLPPYPISVLSLGFRGQNGVSVTNTHTHTDTQTPPRSHTHTYKRSRAHSPRCLGATCPQAPGCHSPSIFRRRQTKTIFSLTGRQKQRETNPRHKAQALKCVNTPFKSLLLTLVKDFPLHRCNVPATCAERDDCGLVVNTEF